MLERIFKRKPQPPQEKTPQQIIDEGDAKRARGEGLRDDEREIHNRARHAEETEAFIKGEGPSARALEREIKNRQEQRKKAQEKIQQRISKLEELVLARQDRIDITKKEIDSLNRAWSGTNDLNDRSSLSMSVKMKEQALSYYQKEFDQYLQELEEKKLEMLKTNY